MRVVHYIQAFIEREEKLFTLNGKGSTRGYEANIHTK